MRIVNHPFDFWLVVLIGTLIQVILSSSIAKTWMKMKYLVNYIVWTSIIDSSVMLVWVMRECFITATKPLKKTMLNQVILWWNQFSNIDPLLNVVTAIKWTRISIACIFSFFILFYNPLFKSHQCLCSMCVKSKNCVGVNTLYRVYLRVAWNSMIFGFRWTLLYWIYVGESN